MKKVHLMILDSEGESTDSTYCGLDYFHQLDLEMEPDPKKWAKLKPEERCFNCGRVFVCKAGDLMAIASKLSEQWRVSNG